MSCRTSLAAESWWPLTRPAGAAVGVDDGGVPHFRSLDSQEEPVAAERRRAHVTATRVSGALLI